MSTGRTVLTFRDGVSLALSRELEADTVIEVDQDFSQAELRYDEAAWNVIEQKESHGKTIMKISGWGPHPVAKKRKLSNTGETSNRMKSVVTTAEGKLVSASPAETPEEKREATLTATQRRNKNRRIHRMLKRLTEEQHEETGSRATAVADRETSPKLPAQKTVLKSIVVETPREDVTAGETPTDLELIGGRVGVEPYIPQFVSRPRPFQIIAEHELEKIQAMGKQTFRRYERVRGQEINILEGLELYTNVFSYLEQAEVERCVLDMRDLGRAGRLRGKTYSEPRKWKPGKGRITIQCGCCYNYAKDQEGNLPGILRYDEVEPLPSVIKEMIKRMISWRVLPADCVPNSCIINIYEEGDCIPPHIDHHDFVRPFCTVSLVSECDIMFGTNLRIVGPGVFDGPAKIPLPVGSVLVLQGNGADIAKHCIPGVPTQRISVTFRRMDDSKVPYRFRSDPELENLRPFEM